MNYGVNFGYPNIPVEIRRKLPRTMKLETGEYAGKRARLVGATDDSKLAPIMREIADNGHRGIGSLTRKGWIGIYVY